TLFGRRFHNCRCFRMPHRPRTPEIRLAFEGFIGNAKREIEKAIYNGNFEAASNIEAMDAQVGCPLSLRSLSKTCCADSGRALSAGTILNASPQMVSMRHGLLNSLSSFLILHITTLMMPGDGSESASRPKYNAS